MTTAYGNPVFQSVSVIPTGSTEQIDLAQVSDNLTELTSTVTNISTEVGTLQTSVDDLTTAEGTATTYRDYGLPGRSAENVCLLFSSAESSDQSGQCMFGMSFSVNAPYTGIRLILANYDTSAEMVLNGIIAAPSASAASSFSPVDSTGVAIPYTTATVNGSTAATIPAAVDAATPSYLLTDIIPIESLERTDGGEGYLIYARTTSGTDKFQAAYLVEAGGPGGVGLGGWGDPSLAGFNEDMGSGRAISCYSAVGDYVTTAAEQTSLTAAILAESGNNPTNTSFTVFGATFISTQRCLTLCGCGDSLTQGYLSGSGYAGFPRLAVNMLTSDTIGVSLMDAGWSGQTTTKIDKRMRALLAAGIKPHIITIPIDSPNDYNAGVTRIPQESLMLRLAEYCDSLGITVFLMTPLPYTDTSTGYEKFPTRQLSGAKVRASTSRDWRIFDAEEVICDYIPTTANPAKVITSYQNQDHYNKAGQTALATALAALVTPLIEA